MTQAGDMAVEPRAHQRVARDPMLPYYAYRGAEALVGALPQSVSYWLGDRAADALLATVPNRFDGLRDNLRHIVPTIGDRHLKHLIRRNVRNLTHCWVDVMEMSSRRTDLPSRIDMKDLYHFEDAIARGNGVVVASMHFGSWEVGLAGWNKMGGKMALLAEVLPPTDDRVEVSEQACAARVRAFPAPRQRAPAARRVSAVRRAPARARRSRR